MLKIENVKKIYKKDKDNIVVLNGVNYNFKKGIFYAIIGKSGSGKSTLMQILGCLDDDYKGKVLIENVDIASMNSDEKATIRAEKIGFIFQSFYLNKNLNALDNVILPLFIKNNLNLNEKYLKAKKILKSLDMESKYNNFPDELSGGEQQRVAIARALINNPDIILADEPTGSLDINSEKEILNILQELRNNDKCVIVVTHSNEVLKYADIILKISNGELIEYEK